MSHLRAYHSASYFGEFHEFHLISFGFIASKPSPTPKATETPDKPVDEPAKKAAVDDDLDNEEIADDLSEISDEADDILGQQEVKSSEATHFSHVFFERLPCFK